MKVRIALVVDAEGNWVATGWGYVKKKPISDKAAMEYCRLNWSTVEGRLESEYFIEAEVELPKPTTIEGKVGK